MHNWFALLTIFANAISIAHAEEPELAAGQVWSTNVPSAPNLKVYIGKIDDESDDILHIAISDLPDLEMDPSILDEISYGKPVIETHMSCMTCIPMAQQEFYVSFSMAPSINKNTVSLKVLYVPVERSILVPQLDTVLESYSVATPWFIGGFEGWDYLRDNYGLEYDSALISTEPLSYMVKLVSQIAKRRVKFLAETKDDIPYFDGTVEIKNEVDLSSPIEMTTAEEILFPSESSSNNDPN